MRKLSRVARLSLHRNNLLNTIIFETKNGAEIFQSPVKILAPTTPEDALNAIDEIEAAVNDGFYACGYFSYEFGYLTEPALRPLLPHERKLPLLWFGIYLKKQILSHSEYHVFIENNLECNEYIITKPDANEDLETYSNKHEKIHNRIKNGVFYQTNFTFKLKGKFFGDELALFNDLRTRQTPKYGAFLRTDAFSILSLSPELGFEIDNGKITCHPMKGTAPIGGGEALIKDEKNRAENLMIVDLMRNDFSRIGKNVKVPHLFKIEDYETLHQMVSQVCADLKPNIKIIDILRAIFPLGSITGAPKISAMNAIAEFENEPREAYCGSIGYFSKDYSRFNVAIRTPIILGNDYLIGIGSGLVYDSNSESEFEECLLKAKFLTDLATDFGIFETIKWEKTKGFIRKDLHLKRLKSAAQTFGIWREHDFENALLEIEKNIAWDTARIKVTIEKNSNEIQIFPFSDPKEKWKFSVCATKVNSKSPWFYYKTTRRNFYDTEWQKANEIGVDEIIFINENGHLTEGSRTNIFLDMGDGLLLTPPIECGLLGGVLRQELLETGKAKTAILTTHDLIKAKKIYLGNSLRGLKPSEL